LIGENKDGIYKDLKATRSLLILQNLHMKFEHLKRLVKENGEESIKKKYHEQDLAPK